MPRKKIFLNNNGGYAFVDMEDYPKVKGYTWYLSNDGYACTNLKNEDGTYRVISIQRLITEAKPSERVRILDGNKLNCTRNNLQVREANHPSNAKKSKYRGVSYHIKSGLWYGRIKIKGKTISLGYFTDEIACANAYNWYAEKYHKERAKLNDCPYMKKTTWKLYTKKEH